MKQKDVMMSVDTWLLTDEYPLEMFDEMTWKLLLYLYRMVDIDTGIVDICYSSFNQVYKCEAEEYISALDELEMDGLIGIVHDVKPYEVVLVVTPENQAIMAEEDDPERVLFTRCNLCRFRDSHIMMWKDLFDLAYSELSLEELRLLLLLIKHSQFEELEGVNPDYMFLCRDAIVYSSLFIDEMGLSTQEIDQCYKVLELSDFIFLRDVSIAPLITEEEEGFIISCHTPPTGVTQQVVVSDARLLPDYKADPNKIDAIKRLHEEGQIEDRRMIAGRMHK